ncbi:MAG: DUF1820 family protein [Methylococcaceae bacterium]
MSEKHIYKVAFVNQEYEVYVKNVYQGAGLRLYSDKRFYFWREKLDAYRSAEEKLKAEFQSMARCFIPLHVNSY